MTSLSPLPLLRAFLRLLAAWIVLAVMFEVAMLGPRFRGEAFGGQTWSLSQSLAVDNMPENLAAVSGASSHPNEAGEIRWSAGLLFASISSAKITVLVVLITLSFGPVLGVILARVRKWPFLGVWFCPWFVVAWLPPFWLAALAVWCQVEFWGHPGYADSPPAHGGPVEWENLWRIGLIAVLVSLSAIGWQIRNLSEALLLQSRAPHVRAAQVRGLKGAGLFYRHVFRNSLEPVTRCPDRSFPAMLGMQMLVEWAVHYPGLGRLIIESARTGHPAGILGGALVAATAVVLTRWIGEFLHHAFDRSPS